jgi:hypothetical protein
LPTGGTGGAAEAEAEAALAPADHTVLPDAAGAALDEPGAEAPETEAEADSAGGGAVGVAVAEVAAKATESATVGTRRGRRRRESQRGELDKMLVFFAVPLRQITG